MLAWAPRLLLRLLNWVDERGPPPRLADFRAFEQAWDYAQADQQAWVNEPDAVRLSAALKVRATDRASAIPELRALAAMGSPLAADLIGESYYWGRGLPQDKAEGLRWFEAAHKAGSWRGLLNHGKALIFRGDFEAAADVLREGAGRRWGPALYWGAMADWRRKGRFKERLARVTAPLTRATAQGSPAARDWLAVFMAFGFYGLRRIPRGWRLFGVTQRELAAHQAARRTLLGRNHILEKIASS